MTGRQARVAAEREARVAARRVPAARRAAPRGPALAPDAAARAGFAPLAGRPGEAAGAAPSGLGTRAGGLAPERSVSDAAPTALDLEVLAGFFGAGPAWADPAAGRYRFRLDVPAGGWLELFVAPAERLVSLRVADGAVTALHVDMTLDEVESVGLRGGGDGEPWLEIACGRGPEATPCTVRITLRPDILVVLGYGRR